MISGLLSGIAGLVVGALNALIAALAVAVMAALTLLPEMPAFPTPPPALVLAESWVAWVFPVQTLINVLLFVLSMFFLWQMIAIALRWAKALNDS